MPKLLTITLLLEDDDEYYDPDDSTGLTEHAYNLVCESVGYMGDDLTVEVTDA